ncbi:hypothetical protein OHB04_22915 [Streptomyces sp. NBC_01775]|uniref:hypothetical protein n=1 Tax=Streptomyces sp. NBC_01775 TaxID=2975939 RepID=UPI002DD96F6A|nr:hypothetical protein [Streptomyces sp. NBC_01775]WSB81963.1 hypothetical protein OHB04_22915 [Streptomyces sp. NBC_01775]
MSAMTLRISRDTGRTWDERTVRTTKPPPLGWSMRYPPCRCPRCREAGERNGT